MTDLSRDFARFSLMMKKCSRIYTLVFYTYLVAGIIFILYSVISGVFIAWEWLYICLETDTPSSIVFVMTVDSLIVAPPAFAMAFAGSYGKKDLYAMFAPALVVLNLIFLTVLKMKGFFDLVPLSFYVGAGYSLLCVIVSALNIRANISYHFLEEQYGFPHFNERFAQQEEDKFQDSILDRFTMKMQDMQKTSSDSMDEIKAVDKTLEKYEHIHIPSDMDDI